MLDIRRALEFVSEDERASSKIAVGVLLLLVPILNIVVIGYEVEVARRVARGEQRPLPTWDDLGQLFVVGARLSLARFIYSLPILAVVVGGMLAGLALALQVPQGSDQAFWQRAGPVILLGGLCLLGGVFAYGLGIGVLSPAILAEYAQRGTFGACFDFAAIWRFIWRAPGQYLTLWLVDAVIAVGVGLLGSVVGIIVGAIPCLGSLVLLLVSSATALFILLVDGHLVGQLLRASQPSPLKES